MLEAICSTCRVVAGEARLLILHALAADEELAGKEIAGRVGLTPPGASKHLARLVGAGLVWRRRSGAYVYYGIATKGTEALGATVAGLIRRACRDPGWATTRWADRGLVHLSDRVVSQLGQARARALDVAFDAATAFDNVRRLQMVRLLLAEGACQLGEVGTRLRMSLWACERHMDKLDRRGVVQRVGPDMWALATRWSTPFHRALCRVVRGAIA